MALLNMSDNVLSTFVCVGVIFRFLFLLCNSALTRSLAKACVACGVLLFGMLQYVGKKTLHFVLYKNLLSHVSKNNNIDSDWGKGPHTILLFHAFPNFFGFLGRYK